MKKRWISLMIVVLGFLSTSLLFAQETTPPIDCTAEGLFAQQQALLTEFPIGADVDSTTAQANLFALGAAYQDLALACGLVPDEEQKAAQIKRTLQFATIADMIAATSVGYDVDTILVELDNTYGDSFEGQLLYNGIATGLDGTELGCMNCHNGVAAPSVEGTWTRVDEIRLQDPALVDYDIRRYLVESILHPANYLAPNFTNVMPPNYGSRLDLAMLANLVAYLESQDQLLEDGQ